MSVYGVQQRVGVHPPEWIVTIADDNAPGKAVPLMDVGAFASEEAAAALVSELTMKQIRQ